ncbi:MAG: DUF87 domain-containing protein [Candidatus Micrarchaeaceae archaeon]
MIALSDDLSISEQSVLTGRCCIIGQSGSGKSFLVGVIAEELAKQHLPFAIIDTEGEYRSLKSLFEVIWVSDDPSADVGFNVDFASLIEKSMLGIPIILDVSEQTDQVAQVYKFLQQLYEIEDKVRRPYLAIIEEADKFAPQVKRGELNIVEEISVRGRKRGLGILVATQRPANISKNVLAQCSYGFIGRLSIENDVNAVSILFGDKNELKEIVSLHTGEFMPFGLEAPRKIKIKKRAVEHISSTPELAQLPGEDLSKAISELRASIGKPSYAKHAPSERAIVFEERFGYEYANSYARRAARSTLISRGFNVESIEPKYIRLTQVILRIPTRKRNVYVEKQLILFGNKILSPGSKGFRSFELKSQRLDSASSQILSDAVINGSIKLSSIEESLGAKTQKLISSLKASGRVEIHGNKIKPGKWYELLNSKEAGLEERQLHGGAVINPQKSAKAKDLVASILPSAIIVKIVKLHLKVYEITLRKGTVVKMLRIDSYTGKEISA